MHDLLASPFTPPFPVVQPDSLEDWQWEFLDLIQRGIPIGVAASQIGRSPFEVLARLNEDEDFRSAYETARFLLCSNVEAAVYQAAMKGKVPAQMFWLMNRHPDSWKQQAPQPQGIEAMSDEQLIREAERMGIDVESLRPEGDGAD